MESYECTCVFTASVLFPEAPSPEPTAPTNYSPPSHPSPPRSSPPRPINYMDWEGSVSGPAAPLDPAKATLLLCTEVCADEARTIAQGLLATLRIREAETAAYQTARDAELSNLGRIIRESRTNSESTCASPDPPTGFVRNVGQAPNFFIPVSDGFFQPAYWVKQLPNGQVAGLLKDDPSDVEPHIGDLFCAERTLPTNGPILPMPAWLLELFAGSPSKFQPLEEAVDQTGDWALKADVRRLRNTMDAVKVKNHQISILAREIRLAEEISERTELRLANAGLADKVSALRALTTHRFEGRPNRRQIALRS